MILNITKSLIRNLNCEQTVPFSQTTPLKRTGVSLQFLDYKPWTHFIFYFGIRGLPFISHLDSLPNFTRSSDGPVRLPIVDKYKVSCRVTGTCSSLLPPPFCPWLMCGREIKTTIFVFIYSAKFSIFKSLFILIVFTKTCTLSISSMGDSAVWDWPCVSCWKLFTLLVSPFCASSHISYLPFNQHLCW